MLCLIMKCPLGFGHRFGGVSGGCKMLRFGGHILICVCYAVKYFYIESLCMFSSTMVRF